MATISNSGKVAYMYDQDTDTWQTMAGIANTVVNYSWAGTHEFLSPSTFSDVLKAQAGVNNFQNASSRDSAIPSPINGVVAMVRQDGSGNPVNQLQYYYNGAWIVYGGTESIVSKSSNYQLVVSDVGSTISTTSSSPITITVPNSTSFVTGSKISIIQTGAGQVTVAAASGVILNSLNGNKKSSGRYGRIDLLNVSANTWILTGDLAA